MRNLLALIGLVVIGFAGIGWYCEWYTFSVTKGGEGRPEIKTIVNTEKVSSDSSSFFQRMGQLMSDKSKLDEKKAVTPEPKSNEKTGTSQGGWLLSPSRPASSTGTGNR